MEIGPIFRALIHQRSRFWLIVLEIALTLAVVANCLHMIQDQRARFLRPTGIDEENLLAVISAPFSPEFEDEDYLQASYEEDLRVLRSLPGVIAASAMHQLPLSDSGSSASRLSELPDAEEISVPFFDTGTDALRTLGLELVAGRDFIESDFRPAGTNGTPESPEQFNVIVTQNLADLFYPDGNALGRVVQDDEGAEVEKIVGIVRRMHCSWPLSSLVERSMLRPVHPQKSHQTRYLVRAEPGMLDELHATVEARLFESNQGRILRVLTLKEIKGWSYGSVVAMVRLLVGLSVLLVVVTSLGIIGLTSFSVTQRTHEIGTRRALGATRLAILRHFLVENWVVTSSGLVLGVLLTFALNYALAEFAAVPRIGWPVILFGMLILWSVGLLAALAPAARGTTVAPVVATRSV